MRVDAVSNPYTPNAGAAPEIVVGRDDLLEAFTVLLQRLERGRTEQSMIVTGLRARGVAVAYVTFEGEGHGFRQAANIRAAMDGELAFYAQVLGFDLPPDEGIPAIAIA